MLRRNMKSLFTSVIALTMAIASAEAAVQEFAKSNNLFATAVYKEIIKNISDNFLFSPYSPEIILALTQSGCKGDTGREIRNALYLPDDNDKIEVAVKESLSALNENGSYTLYTANKMYVQNGFPIRNSFKKSAVEVYGAEVESINFADREAAAKTMNKWVEDQTNNKIQDLIEPSVLNNNVILILINALYFKGKWLTQFEKSATKKTEFYKTAEDVVMVDMMYQQNVQYNYYESSELNAKFLELPYKGEDVSMVIVLPNEKEGLRILENQIDKVLVPQNLTKERVNVVLPKFKIESNIEFNDILQNLGIKKAFTDGDLSGIAGTPGDIVIDKVVQKTFVDVSEDGVEAAAATYISFIFKSAGYLFERKNFVANHPFIFYIKAKDYVLFVGRVLDPNY